MKISEKDEWITGHVAMNALKENFALRESFLVLVFCYYLGFILMTSVVVFMLWTSSWFLAMNFLLSMIYFQFHACEMSTSSHSTIFLNHKHNKRISVTIYQTQQFPNIKAWLRILIISRVSLEDHFDKKFCFVVTWDDFFKDQQSTTSSMAFRIL